MDIGKYNKLRAKNDCPKIDNKKGIFATRAPCRFNPIGMSAVRIESVDAKGGTALVSGIDLVNGTKIIDIKPYTQSDKVMEAKDPAWVKSKDALEVSRLVEISGTAVGDINKLVKEGKLEFYKDAKEVTQLIWEVLRQNPHSKAAIKGEVISLQ